MVTLLQYIQYLQNFTNVRFLIGLVFCIAYWMLLITQRRKFQN